MTAADFESAITGRLPQIEERLPQFIANQRWFASKAHGIRSCSLQYIRGLNSTFGVAVAHVRLRIDQTESYVLPLALTLHRNDCEIFRSSDGFSVSEASSVPAFWRLFVGAESLPAPYSKNATPVARWSEREVDDWTIEVSNSQQSNTSVGLGDRFFLKLFRRLQVGINPDIEITQALTTASAFKNSPGLAAEFCFDFEADVGNASSDATSACIGMVTRRIPCQSDAWVHTLKRLSEFWGAIDLTSLPPEPASWQFDQLQASAETSNAELEVFANEALLLGKRTAEMHKALASIDSPDFCSEMATPAEAKTLVEVIRQETTATETMLKSNQRSLKFDEALSHIFAELMPRLSGLEHALGHQGFPQTRVHGDYHLGQVLWTGSDFFIIDFEGEPERPINERRRKRSPYKDVAGMIRSFHYASSVVPFGMVPNVAAFDPSVESEAWQRYWFSYVSRSFLTGYVNSEDGAQNSVSVRQALLDLFLIEKTLYELRYEINNRPDWIAVPIAGLALLV